MKLNSLPRWATGVLVALTAIGRVEAAAVLEHRYSFSDDGSAVATDSVGSAHGTVQASAVQSGGSVVLNGTANAYVSLPSGLISGATISQDAVTFESWARFENTGRWSRLFDFGNTAGTSGTDYLFFTPYGDPLSGGSIRFSSSFDQLVLPGNLVNQPPWYAPDLHIVCVADFAQDRARIYLNGALLGEDPSFTVELANVNNVLSYLGRSLWASDPRMIGSINEFRIYDGALTALQVAASYESGPDLFNLDPGAVTDLQIVALDGQRPGSSVESRVYATASALVNNPVEISGDPALSFDSTNPAVLTVNGDGIFSAWTAGTALVTATFDNGGPVAIGSKTVNVFNVDYVPLVLPELTDDIRNWTDGAAYNSLFPSSPVFAGVPFELTVDDDGDGVYFGGTIDFPQDGYLEIDVNQAGVYQVYSLISLAFGQPGQYVGYVSFQGSGGLYHTEYLVAGYNVRDHFYNINQPFTNSTSDPSVTENVFGTYANNTSHLDMQTFTLPAEFRTAVLEKVSFYTFAPFGNVRLGQPFLAGMTVGVNVAPTVTILAPPSGALATIGESVQLTGSFTDDDVVGTHTATWIFSRPGYPDFVVDGTISGSSIDNFVEFAEVGIYSITLVVQDPAGNVGQANTVNDLPAYVVVYDPDAGFVTGGGWVWSPQGSLYPGDWNWETYSIEGRANFGFVSKYQKGATVPTGQTEFQFKAGGINFHSSTYQWMLVAGARAKFKGTGTINGEGNFGFMLTAIDGAISGGGGQDRFRIKIWDIASDQIVYDNQAWWGDDDPLLDHTILGGGSIIIHK